MAGRPESVPGETVNRLCASGMSAVIHGQRAISAGHGEIFVCGGVEHMTRGPMVMSKSSSAYGGDMKVYDSTFGWRFINPKMEEMYGVESMGQTAENLACHYKISRDDQDKFAYFSQMKAYNATQKGRFKKEIIPIHIPQRKKEPIVFSEDEFIKPYTTIEGLASLRPAFHSQGSVTAGNSSGLNDGAAALLISSEKALSLYNMVPLAKVVSSDVVGVSPSHMGIGPVPASQLALKRAGLTWDDIDIIEINEAFAAQVLACIRALGLNDDDPRINPNGGAIALGHPLGMTGARILLSSAIELIESNKKYALVSMCVGVGQGFAVILQNPHF